MKRNDSKLFVWFIYIVKFFYCNLGLKLLREVEFQKEMIYVSTEEDQ